MENQGSANNEIRKVLSEVLRDIWLKVESARKHLVNDKDSESAFRELKQAESAIAFLIDVIPQENDIIETLNNLHKEITEIIDSQK